MRFLIVDDDIIIRNILSKQLGALGECIHAENGLEGMVKYRVYLENEQQVDLITLDINMPKMDGHETMKEMRMLENKFHVPAKKRARIVMITSMKQRDHVIRAVQSGVNGFLVKPFTTESLWETLNKLGIGSV